MMLGSQCSPCCDTCGGGKPYSDPKDEGTWVPSGTWLDAGGVTWTFVENPGDESGDTWFFYGSSGTSRLGGGASTAEQRDWNNRCNWYSNKTSTPSERSGMVLALNKRAARLPPNDAIVHVYADAEVPSVVTVKSIYVWGAKLFGSQSVLSVTHPAHDSFGGAVFSQTARSGVIISGGATFVGGFNDLEGTVNGGADFLINGGNIGTVSDGAIFNDNSGNFITTNAAYNIGIVNGGAAFVGRAYNRAGQIFVLGNAIYRFGTVNGGATFSDISRNNELAIVEGGAIFNDQSYNSGTVNGGAIFNDSSVHRSTGIVNGGATFNDAACSTKLNVGMTKFVTNFIDSPICNGTAQPKSANPASGCGCN